jgi:Uma2 family endonuclease
MRAATKPGEFSYVDYQRWPDSERCQLLDGHAYAMAPPSTAHQTVVFELARQLGNALLGGPCRAFACPIGVRLPLANEADDEVRTVFEPDLLMVCDADKIDARGIRGAPDLVIEVLSPSTAAFDQIEKRAAYERAGVRELWLIEIASGVVTRFLLEGARFAAPVYLHASGRIELTVGPGLSLELDFMRALRSNESR